MLKNYITPEASNPEELRVMHWLAKSKLKTVGTWKSWGAMGPTCFRLREGHEYGVSHVTENVDRVGHVREDG
jgi:hypothetical protein